MQAHLHMTTGIMIEWKLVLVNMHTHAQQIQKNKTVTYNSGHLQGGKWLHYPGLCHWSPGFAVLMAGLLNTNDTGRSQFVSICDSPQCRPSPFQSHLQFSRHSFLFHLCFCGFLFPLPSPFTFIRRHCTPLLVFLTSLWSRRPHRGL